jgi:thymidylate synthase
MYFYGATLDDLLHRVLEKLLKSHHRINPTRGGATELAGVLLKLANPRARLSRTEKKGHIFSPLGELLWYLTKKNDVKFIQYYVERYAKESDDGRTVHGGYGPRLFAMRGCNQVENVLQLLKDSPDSRRAVIQLFDAPDIAKRHKEIAATRDDCVNHLAFFRSWLVR